MISTNRYQNSVLRVGLLRVWPAGWLSAKMMAQRTSACVFLPLILAAIRLGTSHAWEHEVLIHEGRGELFSDGRWIEVRRGSVIFIPAQEKYQFRNNSDQDMVFACLIPSGVAEL